jgi:hypothetical protein
MFNDELIFTAKRGKAIVELGFDAVGSKVDARGVTPVSSLRLERIRPNWEA